MDGVKQVHQVLPGQEVVLRCWLDQIGGPSGALRWRDKDRD